MDEYNVTKKYENGEFESLIVSLPKTFSNFQWVSWKENGTTALKKII